MLVSARGVDSGMTGMFDADQATASPRHKQLFRRYQKLYTLVDFCAAVAFIVGSIFFFSESLTRPADWLFLVGSILFAVRPTISVIREFHLSKVSAHVF